MLFKCFLNSRPVLLRHESAPGCDNLQPGSGNVVPRVKSSSVCPFGFRRRAVVRKGRSGTRRPLIVLPATARLTAQSRERVFPLIKNDRLSPVKGFRVPPYSTAYPQFCQPAALCRGLNSAVGLVLAVEGAIFIYKGVNWLIRKIPGIS